MVKLTSEERNSALWHKLDAVLKERLESYRRMNDNPQTPEQTATLRGRISEIKKLRNSLAMETSPAQVMDGE